MIDKEKNDNDNDFYEDAAQVADFVHYRLDNVVEPTALNNTVEEYVKKDDEGNK